jgi:hypothetical protein
MLPNTDKHRCLAGKIGFRSYSLIEKDAPLVSNDKVNYNQHLQHENRKSHWIAAMTKQSYEPPPPPQINCVTWSEVTISTNVLGIIALALRFTSIHSNLFTMAEAIDSLHLDHWKWTMQGELILILFNNTFTTSNSIEARQWQPKPIGSIWVYRINHNPDGTLQYKAGLVSKGNEQIDIIESLALAW